MAQPNSTTINRKAWYTRQYNKLPERSRHYIDLATTAYIDGDRAAAQEYVQCIGKCSRSEWVVLADLVVVGAALKG